MDTNYVIALVAGGFLISGICLYFVIRNSGQFRPLPPLERGPFTRPTAPAQFTKPVEFRSKPVAPRASSKPVSTRHEPSYRSSDDDSLLYGAAVFTSSFDSSSSYTSHCDTSSSDGGCSDSGSGGCDGGGGGCD